MRRLFLKFTVLLGLSLFVGCGQNYSEQEFGTIVKGLPKIEGIDKPYDMPELGPPLPANFNPRNPPR
jgi:hypothetical protein